MLAGTSRPCQRKCKMRPHVFIDSRFKKTSVPSSCLTAGSPGPWQMPLLTIFGNQDVTPVVCCGLLTNPCPPCTGWHGSAANHTLQFLGSISLQLLLPTPGLLLHQKGRDPYFNYLRSVLSLTVIFCTDFPLEKSRKGHHNTKNTSEPWWVWQLATQAHLQVSHNKWSLHWASWTRCIWIFPRGTRAGTVLMKSISDPQLLYAFVPKMNLREGDFGKSSYFFLPYP